MSALTENDLKELKTFIETKFENIETKFEKIDGRLEKITENINDLKVDLSGLKAEFIINNKRLDNTDFIIRSIFVGIVVTTSTTVLIGVLKLILPLFPNL